MILDEDKHRQRALELAVETVAHMFALKKNSSGKSLAADYVTLLVAEKYFAFLTKGS
jgi:hypothetical protein